MTFMNPNTLYLLMLLPVIAFVVQLLRRKRYGIVYSSDSVFEGVPISCRQRLLFVPSLLLYLAVASFMVGLARPQIEVTNQRQDRQGIAIQLLIDVSSSMSMNIKYRDESRTRMEVAKTVVETFIVGDGKELTGRPDDLIGIVAFSRYADIVCPLTLGHEALIHYVRELEVNERANEDGTAFGDAACLAAARLKAMEDSTDEDAVKSKVIVLLTDGENNAGIHLPLQAAALAKEWGIRIYTISIQEEQEARVKETEDGSFLVPEARSQSDQLLEKMASMTGGIFRTAHDFDSLQAVYKEINALEKTKMKGVAYTDTDEAFHWFVWTGLVLLLLQYLLSATVFRVTP